jgi:HlyD family secretion protein
MINIKNQKQLSLVIAVILILTTVSCSGISPQPTPTPDINPIGETSPVVSITGVVLPQRWATLSFSMTGVISEILVEEGEQIEAGQIIARSDNREQIEATIEANRLLVLEAQRSLDDLYEQAEVAAAQALQDVALAREALDIAEDQWDINQPGNRGTEYTIKAAKANVVILKKRLDKAQKMYKKTHGKVAKAKAQIILSDAHRAYNSAVWLLDWLKEGADEIEQAVLDANVELAQASLDFAQEEWERLEDGPDPDDVVLLEQQLANAQAQLKAAEATLEDTELRAPFTGTISKIFVNPNEWISPGQPIAIIADLDQLIIETTDLNEIDRVQINVGDRAEVFFDALPDLSVGGEVTYIASKASEGSGVNYTAEIELDSVEEEIYWGMTAFIDIVVQ